jgi:hypothetical protein
METEISAQYEHLTRLSDSFLEAGDMSRVEKVNQRLLELDLAFDPSLWPLDPHDEKPLCS